MKVKLKKLHIKNFKGVSDFVFTPDGQDAALYGDNGAGKTTISDATAWLLTDADSEDNVKFEIKTLDENSNIVPNLEPSVEALLDIDSKSLTLKKTFKSVFTGKGFDKLFDGHKTVREINGLSVSKQKYQAKLEELAPKDVLKILLNPSYFKNLPTAKKRKAILGLIDNVTQEYVIASDKKLTGLPDIISPHTPEQYKEISQKQKTKLKKQREEITISIKERQNNQPDPEGLNKENVLTDIKTHQDKKTAAEEEKFQLENGGNIGVKTQELAEIEAEKLCLEIQFKAAISKDILAETTAQNQIEADIKQLENNKTINQGKIALENSSILTLDAEMKKLREDWKTVKAKEYDTPPEICPECGQKIPEDQHKESQEKGFAKFNSEKADNLSKINTAGKKLLGAKTKAEDELHEIQKTVQKNEKDLEVKQENLLSIAEVIQTLKKQKLESSKYKAILEKKAACEAELEATKKGDISTQVEKLTGEIEAFKNNIQGLANTLQNIKKKEADEVRIKELEKQQKTLAKEFETLEKNIDLVDLYIKKWVEMVEGPVNDLFKITEFKMFETLINGGLRDACTAMYNGIPVDGALNFGHQRIVGVDIIQTFSNHHGVHLPLFIDNVESVTSLPEIDTQVIKLVKPEITKANKEYYSKLQTVKHKEE